SSIADLGFINPTPVQCAVVRPAIEGRDLVVQSKTGSGKTSAFGIPLTQRIDAGKGAEGTPLALVVVPTRELAHQVAAELRLLSAKKGTRVLAVYGGVPMGRQIAVLRAGVDVIVGTPGRLLDHVRRKNLSLAALETFVLDEADEMLSMGFWEDVTSMLSMAPKQRQTMLFSATLPYEVAKAASQFLKDPARIDLSGDTLSVDRIDNNIYHIVPTMPKPRQLLYVLERERPESAIIFCNTRNETEMIAKFLTTSGFIAEPLSGNLKQRERERVMMRIKAGELRYMVATDIAARGIDIEDLSHVVNYSLPEFTEVFLHRVGRTGRIGKRGTAVSLVDGMGLGTLTKLEREFGLKFVEQKLPPEEEAIALRSQRIMKDLADKASVAEVGSHLAAAQEILDNTTASPQIVAFLLKQYFGNQAADAERRSRVAQNDRQRDEGGGEHIEARSEGERPPRESGRDGGRRRRGSRDAGREERPDRGPRPDRVSGAGRGELTAAEALGLDTGGESAASASGDAEGGAGDMIMGEDGIRRRRRRRRRGRGRGERDGVGTMETLDAAELLAREPGAEGGSESAEPREARPPREARAPREHREPREPRSNGLHQAAAVPIVVDDLSDGLSRLRVNIGFDDGFKGRGAVAKKIASLAGLNEGIVHEVEARRDHAVLKATADIAELVVERVDGATIGKKVVSIALATP
ncbi:MAG: DEAD/DEAH box helicase, partial [Clostridia bacterium]|nr:DEAD/DEAH box helicase [Deltaproteobacteria bacterium]